MSGQIQLWFGYPDISKDKQEKITKIKAAASVMCDTIGEITVRSADQTTAFRKVREAVHVTIDAILLEGQ